MSEFDGHTGLKNEVIRSQNSKLFDLVLSHVQLKGGDAFVIHASPFSEISFEFLTWIGFTSFDGPCPFHKNKRWCFWLLVGHTRSETLHSIARLNSMISGFTTFVDKIDELFD